jgi:hypothetical protein
MHPDSICDPDLDPGGKNGSKKIEEKNVLHKSVCSLSKVGVSSRSLEVLRGRLELRRNILHVLKKIFS